MSLEKAVSQRVLTLDTLDAQFCSDHLKGQIRELLEELRLLRAVAEAAQDWRQDTEENCGHHPEWKTLAGALDAWRERKG